MVRSKARNRLLRFFTEKEYSHHEILKMVKPMEGMKEIQKEKHSAIMLKIIKDCQTEEEAIKALEEKGIL